MTRSIEIDDVQRILTDLEHPVHVVRDTGGIGVTAALEPGQCVLASAGPLSPENLGSHDFRRAHGVRMAYMAGGMANGISSVELVVAAARAGFLGAFGAGGLASDRVEAALQRLAAEIPGLPYAVNLLNTPHEPALERAVVDLCLRYGVRCVEASAYLELTPELVRYRLNGLYRSTGGQVHAANRVIAKVSRPEVCRQFLLPAPEAMVAELIARGQVTAEQADLSRAMPMADDITVESDSAGHTDRRPLSALLPVLRRLRDDVRRQRPELPSVRLGAAGGIGTPQAVAAAFALGADYVVTGSVNQACVEAGTAAVTRRMLATAGISDFDMAPSGYMFELGAQVQVLKSGTMFPQRARKLRQLYETCSSIDDLPDADRIWLERKVFRRPVGEVWDEVVAFFTTRDPAQIQQAVNDPKRRMALMFRWYLGLSSRWAITGDADRLADYQVWAGPALGAFNEWVRGTYLAAPENRSVTDVAHHLMRGAAVSTRIHQIECAGPRFPSEYSDYRPTPLS
ncbi:PfaD family polyunsaturated fatty acid/polyketide biosynthesis protein [Nocardia sp. XZ_19_385]|uniref:PfaD family polyunsaturated fatty acid/polyketide biosynthesis protein n=1 Tax=Nocardia sp. XZ_19_385 TaxID=2769488 RepID=UPI00188DEB8D|nr:PfaD family polyunsaturated fatty acid/polyketide biosynthesis protein [Nocardia sp. XZ_19_385]